MKKQFFLIAALFLVAATLHAQADQKLIDRANAGDTKAMCDLAICYERGAGVPLDSSQALQWYRRAAEKGDGDAWLCVSRYYLEGRQLPADTGRYFAIRKEWADKGLPNAIAGLGIAYLHGLGVDADTARYVELTKLAASKGSSWGNENLASMYHYGTCGFPKDAKMAEKYYKKALKNDVSRSVDVSLAYFYAQQRNFKKAWTYCNEALKWNDPSAIDLQAQLYFDGSGVPDDELKAQAAADRLASQFPNFATVYSTASRVYLYAQTHRDSIKGVQYLKKGVELGNGLCMLRMSVLYMANGDYQSAMELLNRIVEKDDDDENKGYACGMIGEMYMMGYGVEQNDDSGIVWKKRGAEKYKVANCASSLAEYYASSGNADGWDINQLAVKYYEMAVSLGDTDQLVDLGRYYILTGYLDKAEETFQRLVDYGHPDGYYWLAAMTYQTGDFKKLVKLLEQGDQKGSQICRDVLGGIYEDGDGGVDVNYKKAEKYYLKSGSGRAYNNLGIMYLYGKLGKQSPKDIQTGIAYLEKSAAMNYTDAIFRLGYMYENGEFVDSVDHFKAVKYFKTLADNNNVDGLFKMGLYHELGDGGVEKDSVKSVDYYRRAAAMGHGEAMCYLGDFHRIGQFLPLDKNLAFKYYSAADSIGESLGTYYVGRSYLEGCGVAVDTAQAIPYLRSAANQKIGRAAYLLAEFYNDAKGGMVENNDSASHYYLMAYNNGNADAGYFIGKSLLREGYSSEAVRYLYNAARRGNYDAMVLFALCEMEGEGMDPNPEDGYSILENVVRRVDNASAYYHLGIARINGQGCRQSEKLGKLYLDTAAMLGSISAMNALGTCYLNGFGCAPDTALAIKNFESAAALGSTEAWNRMGYIYEHRDEFEKAVSCYQKAADMGSDEGRCCLGLMYEKGRGVILSHKKAYELYAAAAENGFARGYLMLAFCYLEGINVEENHEMAFNWFVKAAEAGNVVAMYNAASMLEDGENGIPRDLKKAKYWYQQAAAKGYEPAVKAVQRMK